MSRIDVNPAANMRPAYSHGSQVEYFSCTHHCWLRGMLTLDVLDRYVDGLHHTETAVNMVHLDRSHQFRTHVPLYHLRGPLEIGHEVEVCTHAKGPWKQATIKKIRLGKTHRFYVLALQGTEVTVPGSSIRWYFPVQSQVPRDVRRILWVSMSFGKAPAFFATSHHTENRQRTGGETSRSHGQSFWKASWYSFPHSRVSGTTSRHPNRIVGTLPVGSCAPFTRETKENKVPYGQSSMTPSNVWKNGQSRFLRTPLGQLPLFSLFLGVDFAAAW